MTNIGNLIPSPTKNKTNMGNYVASPVKEFERPNWSDTLDLSTAAYFVARLKKFLADKRYTFISAYSDTRTDVRINQALCGRSTKPMNNETYRSCGKYWLHYRPVCQCFGLRFVWCVDRK